MYRFWIYSFVSVWPLAVRDTQIHQQLVITIYFTKIQSQLPWQFNKNLNFNQGGKFIKRDNEIENSS